MGDHHFYNLVRIDFLPWLSHCVPPSHDPTPLLLSDFIRGMLIFTVNEQESLPMQNYSVFDTLHGPVYDVQMSV